MKVIRYDQLKENFFTYKDFQEDILDINAIIEDVKKNKDQALIAIGKKYYNGMYQIELSKEEIENCLSKVPIETEKILKQVIKNKQIFDRKQIGCLKELEYENKESTIGHKIVPLRTVGAYVSATMPISAIYTIVPAKVAGVKEVIMCSPNPQDATVMAAVMSGVDRIFNVGDVHAIAAMAYGTQTIPEVDKIVGSGNNYITKAKKEVYGKCGIDYLSNTNDLLIIADDTANVSYLTNNILSQAKHDIETTSVLITTSEKLVENLLIEIKKQSTNLKPISTADKLIDNSYIILVDSLDQAIGIANKKAPSYLKLCFNNATQFINAFRNFGLLLIEDCSTLVLSQYAIDTNYILPSNGISRYHGGLSVFDFVKIQTYQNISNTTHNFL